MCNACGFYCCASDEMGECGCESCPEPGCMHYCSEHCDCRFNGCDCEVCIDLLGISPEEREQYV